ncbi:MAG: hypothetical protein KME46_01570 [Brasilonema angustatum HA4187-MV1]|jgi:hypothetical protein|nr:hypothetical protein [Brasilonema angustatum HA4187-MV1]
MVHLFSYQFPLTHANSGTTPQQQRQVLHFMLAISIRGALNKHYAGTIAPL